MIWADLNPTIGTEQAGSRPVVVLSENIFNDRSGTVIAAAVTSQQPKAGFPLSLEITSVKLPKKSWIKIGQIRTLSTQRLGARLAHLAPEEVARVIEGLNEILGV